MAWGEPRICHCCGGVGPGGSCGGSPPNPSLGNEELWAVLAALNHHINNPQPFGKLLTKQQKRAREIVYRQLGILGPPPEDRG